ncbi:MAG TPA: HdeD family acid-resistance protein [Candidatus Acidoferrales bacterium]|nr:HdeD family acid-resistance protein [Candidatus Acidoferrales bacterium]
MLHALARNWWALLIRGIAALIFGILAFAWPGVTGFALVILFGAYAFIDGIFALVSAIRAAEAHERWVAFAIEGIIGLVIAAIVLFRPALAGLALYFTIAIWALLTGVFELVAAFQLRKLVPNEWMLILSGILSVIFGVLLVVFPMIGILTVIYLIGFYAIFFGIVMIAFSFRLRAHAN